MSHDVQDLAEQAGRSQTLEFIARFGYAGSGLVHLLIAWIAGQVALGSSSGEADEAGALEQLGGSPLGAVLLWVCVAGFAALAVWHLIEAVVPHHSPAREQLVDRGKALGKAALYGVLGWTALRVVTGSGADSGETTTEATGTLMSAPAGQLLVGAVGVIVLAVGGYHVYKGVSKNFVQDLQRTGQREVSRAVQVLGVTGYVAKGAALGVVGGLIGVAALQADPDQPTGLDAALKTLRDQPLGEVILLLVALGLAAYGLYSFARARYASM